MKKTNLLIILLISLSLLSISVAAQSLTPCDPANNNTECPSEETCQVYQEGYACGESCNCDSDSDCGEGDFCDTGASCGENGFSGGLCEPSVCGDDVVDGNEECDPPEEKSEDCSSDEKTCDENCECIAFCGNSFTEPGEECDPGNGEGPSDEACPGQCQFDCTCASEPTNIFDFLFGMNIANNLLHNKILFMMHIIKEELVQVELKTLEVEMASKPCEDAIFSLGLNKKSYRYAKEEEFDAMVRSLIVTFKNNEEKYPGIDLEQAEQFVEAAEMLNEEGDFDQARACKCKAYKALKGQTDPIDCETPEDQSCGGTQECFCDEFETCPIGCGSCSCEGGSISEGEECID